MELIIEIRFALRWLSNSVCPYAAADVVHAVNLPSCMLSAAVMHAECLAILLHVLKRMLSRLQA